MNFNAEEATNELQILLQSRKKSVSFLGTGTRSLDLNESFDDSDKVREVEELCSRGADLHYLERERGLACIPHVFWSKKLIKFFIDKGLDVNSRDENGDTALHLAVRHIYRGCGIMPNNTLSNVVKFLLEQASADPSIINLQGESAIFTLANSQLLLSVPKNESTDKLAQIMWMAMGTDDEIESISPSSIGLFIDHNIFEGGIDYRTPSSSYSQTLLMLAAGSKKKLEVEHCQELVEKGANINARDLQGYTALHYAVLNRYYRYECAEFLIDKGLDPNAKSVSGKEPYDLSFFRFVSSRVFMYGAPPTKQLELCEIAFAGTIIRHNEFGEYVNLHALRQWDKAMDVCKKFNLQPSQEFLANYEFLKENEKNQNADEEIYRSALDTIARLSQGMLKFWYFITFGPDHHWKNAPYCFRILNYLSAELERVEDFASIEQADFQSLFNWVEFFIMWLEKLVRSKSKTQATPKRISQLHAIAKLVIAGFNKLIQVTNSKNVPEECMETYVSLCHLLLLLQYGFNNTISETVLMENRRLLRSLIDMDLSDQDGNSMLHLILGNVNYDKTTSVIVSLIDFGSVKVNTRNRMGLEPVQCIQKWFYRDKLFVKLGERGAHMDAYRNDSWDKPTLREVFADKEKKSNLWFQFDSLQCMCARVLARSLVPFSNRVPKSIADFIREHRLCNSG